MNGSRTYDGAAVAQMTTADRAAKVYERAVAFMNERTIAFWGHHDEYTKGEPRQYGTGVLLRIDDVHFVLTAEHVANLFLDHNVSLVIAGDRLIPIEKAQCRWSREADVAIIVLPQAIVDKINGSRAKKFARLSEVLIGDPTTDIGGVYAAFGYPSDTSEVDHAAKRMTMVGSPCFGLPLEDITKLTKDFQKGVHVGIHFDANSGPHPGGMSGGGIWRVFQAGGVLSKWSEDDIRLVAIEHTLGEGHSALIGTRIDHVMTLVRSFDPTLDRAISLVWPPKTRFDRTRMVIPKNQTG